jgi:hypothetical protein
MKISQMPEAPEVAHRLGASVPEVMVAHDRDPASGGRPDGEGDAADAIERADVRTEFIMGPVVVAFAEEEKVVFRDRRKETIRVVDVAPDAVGVGHAEAIAEERGAG